MFIRYEAKEIKKVIFQRVKKMLNYIFIFNIS
jgi:hypothetical protein